MSYAEVAPREHITADRLRRQRENAERRFLESVPADPDENGCLIWLGCIDHCGYGKLAFGQGGITAHRYAWERAHGRIRPRLVIDHLCGVRACVNPAHLEPVTHGENIKRGGKPHLHLRGSTA